VAAELVQSTVAGIVTGIPLSCYECPPLLAGLHFRPQALVLLAEPMNVALVRLKTLTELSRETLREIIKIVQHEVLHWLLPLAIVL
jgi:hypothetical protein